MRTGSGLEADWRRTGCGLEVLGKDWNRTGMEDWAGESGPAHAGRSRRGGAARLGRQPRREAVLEVGADGHIGARAGVAGAPHAADGGPAELQKPQVAGLELLRITRERGRTHNDAADNSYLLGITHNSR